MRYDFLIVGAGIAGASAAFELSRSGRVCLIEGEVRPGFHARALTRASRAFFDKPTEGFCEQPLLHPRGCLYIARADQRQQLKEMVESIRASGGVMMSFIDRDDALARVPLLRKEYVRPAPHS